jgi:hypothetical protein
MRLRSRILNCAIRCCVCPGPARARPRSRTARQEIMHLEICNNPRVVKGSLVPNTRSVKSWSRCRRTRAHTHGARELTASPCAPFSTKCGCSYTPTTHSVVQVKEYPDFTKWGSQGVVVFPGIDSRDIVGLNRFARVSRQDTRLWDYMSLVGRILPTASSCVQKLTLIPSPGSDFESDKCETLPEI